MVQRLSALPDQPCSQRPDRGRDEGNRIVNLMQRESRPPRLGRDDPAIPGQPLWRAALAQLQSTAICHVWEPCTWPLGAPRGKRTDDGLVCRRRIPGNRLYSLFFSRCPADRHARHRYRPPDPWGPFLRGSWGSIPWLDHNDRVSPAKVAVSSGRTRWT